VKSGSLEIRMIPSVKSVGFGVSIFRKLRITKCSLLHCLLASLLACEPDGLLAFIQATGQRGEMRSGIVSQIPPRTGCDNRARRRRREKHCHIS
jgi:hypothetical protein